MKKTDLPLILLQTLNRLNIRLSTLAEETDGLILKSYNANNFINFQYVDKNSGFEFELIKIELNNSTPFISFNTSPTSNLSNQKTLKKGNEKAVVQNFINWIGWLKIYNESSLTDEDKFLNNYQNEFYTEFEIIDDDASTSPFSIDQQIHIDKYLDYMETKLLSASIIDKSINEIATDIKILRTELGKSTKKVVIKKLSVIFAKLRKSSVKLLGEFYDASKKEIFKRLLSGGFDELSGLM